MNNFFIFTRRIFFDDTFSKKNSDIDSIRFSSFFINKKSPICITINCNSKVSVGFYNSFFNFGYIFFFHRVWNVVRIISIGIEIHSINDDVQIGKNIIKNLSSYSVSCVHNNFKRGIITCFNKRKHLCFVRRHDIHFFKLSKIF